MANFNNSVDPRLLDSIKTASEDFPYQVVLKSGFREGDPRFHGKHMALDVQLVDPETGKAIPNYQSEENFRTYEQFAQKVRQVQMDKYPELDKAFRWGGYFPGKKNYGAVDLMHFDTGGEITGGMGGGTWDKGLTPQQRKLLPNAVSVGMSQSNADSLISAANKRNQDAINQPSTYDKLVAPTSANVSQNELTNLLSAYKSGQMTPDQMRDFEADASAGKIALPAGVHVGGQKTSPYGIKSIEVPQEAVDAYNQGAINPYEKGAMPDNARREFDADLASGKISLPSGAVLNPHYMGLGARVIEAATGAMRSTPATQNLTELGSGASGNLFDGLEGDSPAKRAMISAALTSGAKGDQLLKIVQAQYPQITYQEDYKGNKILVNPLNGAQYLVDKPGFTQRDAMQTAATAAAMTPAGRATTIAKAGAAAAATEAGLQTVQAAAGGDYHPGEILAAGGLGAAVPAIARAIEAVAPAVNNAAQSIAEQAVAKLAGKPVEEIRAEVAAASKGAASPSQPAATLINPSTGKPVNAPASVTAAPAAPIAEAAPQTAAELTPVARKAGVGGLGSTAAKEELAKAAAPDAETVAAAKRLGIDEFLQPDHVTTNQAFREVAQAVKSIPSSTARTQEIEGLTQVAKRADDVITELGGTHDLSNLGADVNASLSRAQMKADAAAEKLYKQLNDAIPARSPVTTDNVLGFINKRAEDLGGAENLTPIEKAIMRKLEPKETAMAMPEPPTGKITAQQFRDYQAAVKAAQSGETASKMPTYALLDDVRKTVGAALFKKEGEFKDAESGLLKRLYGALTEDQGEAAKQFGVDGVWRSAKAVVQFRKGIEDDLTSLFGKKLDRAMQPAVTRAVAALPKGDFAQLNKLMAAIPKNMRREVAVSGLATAFGKTAKNGQINFNAFYKYWENLMKNTQSYNALMSHLPPEAAQRLTDLYKVSKGIALASRERITTGRIQAIKEDFQGADTLLDKVYYAAAHSAAHAGKHAFVEALGHGMGVPGAGVATAIGSALMKGTKPNAIKAADALISSPEFREAAAQAAKGDVKGASARLAFSKAFVRFARSVGNPREMTDRQKWIMQALEANNQNNSNN